MLRVCLFGGQGGHLSPGRFTVYITIFGGCELRRGTIASQVLARRTSGVPIQTERRAYFLTIFGAAELVLPTLASEYLELMEGLRNGSLDLDEWTRLAAQVASDRDLYIGSFTAFGGFDDSSVASEDDELDQLALAAQLGQIPETARQVLMLAVGQTGAQRLNAVRQAAQASMSGSAFAER
ncbi:MAG: hypothetical protein AB7Q17_04735 [Phycisphaerae bacterium]